MRGTGFAKSSCGVHLKLIPQHSPRSYQAPFKRHQFMLTTMMMLMLLLLMMEMNHVASLLNRNSLPRASLDLKSSSSS